MGADRKGEQGKVDEGVRLIFRIITTSGNPSWNKLLRKYLRTAPSLHYRCTDLLYVLYSSRCVWGASNSLLLFPSLYSAKGGYLDSLISNNLLFPKI
jgi:hypothetical protein